MAKALFDLTVRQVFCRVFQMLKARRRMACFKLERFCSLKFKIEYKYSDSKKQEQKKKVLPSFFHVTFLPNEKHSTSRSTCCFRVIEITT